VKISEEDIANIKKLILVILTISKTMGNKVLMLQALPPM
jgi:hypothetical protein